MNSYNENLQNTVASALQTKNLEMKSLKSQYKASMFSLYYAEGATITADEKLALAKKELTNKTDVQKQAVKNNSISVNQLASAIQANQYVGQSASYMALCASNVKIAANAVTRVASDIGAIYSILHAADRKTDMYTITKDLYKLINKTATSAEIASISAMNATRLTSEVTSSAVLNDSKAANSLMNNVLKITAGDFNTASHTVAADNTTLAATSTNEKKAEGTFENAEIDYLTSFSAYESVNTGLNLGLTALPISAESFFVMFNLIENPFPDEQLSTDTTSTNIWDPVAAYDIFVVKDSKKATFSISEAENLGRNHPEQYVKLVPSAINADSTTVDEKSPVLAEFINYKAVPYVNVPNKTGTYALYDSDGDPVGPGVNYVVFVMAVYLDGYKWSINNFSDFLSAASLSFCMTTLLNAVNTSEMLTEPTTNLELDKVMIKLAKDLEVDLSKIVPEADGSTHLLLFRGAQPGDPAPKVSYRCMFLPADNIPGGLITQSAFGSFTRKQLLFDKITLDRARMLSVVIHELNVKVAALGKKLKGADPKKATELKEEMKIAKAQVEQLTISKRELTGPDVASDYPAFFFNKTLAEKISAGNYTVARRVFLLTDNIPTDLWYTFIGPATTDNFGNLLNGGAPYVPAILSVLESDDEEALASYTSAISAYDGAPVIKY